MELEKWTISIGKALSAVQGKAFAGLLQDFRTARTMRRWPSASSTGKREFRNSLSGMKRVPVNAAARSTSAIGPYRVTS